MEKGVEIILTVKEWAERAGLELYNYDGFTKIYSKLSGDDHDDFGTTQLKRFRDAGDLLCTRKAFESRLMECTMQLPNASQYEKMSDVIPGFVESHVNLKISVIMGQLRHSMIKGDKVREVLEELLNLIKQKEALKKKSIEMDGTTEEAAISDLDTTWFNADEMKIIQEHEGTVESLEAKLSDEVIENLEQMLQRKSIILSELPIDKLTTLTSILYGTARHKESPNLEEEFMYLNVPDQKKDPFIKTYNIIGDERMRTGVMFDIQTEDGRVRGAMPTTAEMDEKIKRATRQKVIVDSELAIEGAEQDLQEIDGEVVPQIDGEIERDAGAELIDIVLNAKEADQALQVIDSEVAPEKRRSLITRISEFAKNIIDKIRGENKGR